MDKWLKLSSASYCKEGLDDMLLALAPGQMRPQQWQDDAERALAEVLGVDPAFVVLTGSGTAALTIAHYMLGNHGRMPVEAPVLTWPSTYSYARNVELRDVLADCAHAVNWSDTPGRVRVPVALWGVEVPAGELSRCRERGPVVYDCSHRFRGGLDALCAGAVNAVTYSFGPTKEVPACRGGAVVSPHVTPAWRAFRDSGTVGRDMVIPSGGNFEIAEPFAALLTEQLWHWEAAYATRQALLGEYSRFLVGPVGAPRLLTQPGASGHLCVVKCESETERDVRIGRLRDGMIECGVHYPLPLWLVPVKFPGALELSSRLLSLPIHTHMGKDDVLRVVNTMEKL